MLILCYLELLRHEDALEGDLVPRPGHAEQPGDPLQEQHAHLHQHNHHNLNGHLKGGKKAEFNSERNDEKISYFLRSAGTS